MKTVFILLGVAFFSLDGFAGDPEGSDGWISKKEGLSGIVLSVIEESVLPAYEARTQWRKRLEDKIWRKRRNAVGDWRTVVYSNPREIFPDLELMLSDRSQKVREAAVTALKEMAVEFPALMPKIVKALAERQSSDSEGLFFEKMTALNEVVGSNSLFTELDASAVDQTFTALYDMVETGLSNGKSISVTLSALQLLDTTLNQLMGEAFNGIPRVEEIPSYMTRGLEIAVGKFADSSPEIRSMVNTLLKEVLQNRSLFSDFQVLQIVSLAVEEGFSNPNLEIKENTIGFLTGIAEMYPSLNSEIFNLLKKRQARASSRRMKSAFGKAMRQLTKQRNGDSNRPGRNPGCRTALAGL